MGLEILRLPVLRGSSITVEFNLDKDLEEAANDVRDKVSQAIRSLPQDIDALLLFLRLMPIVL
jgi:hypothetical protein